MIDRLSAGSFVWDVMDKARWLHEQCEAVRLGRTDKSYIQVYNELEAEMADRLLGLIEEPDPPAIPFAHQGMERCE